MSHRPDTGALPGLAPIKDHQKDSSLSSTLDGIDALLVNSEATRSKLRNAKSKAGKVLPPITSSGSPMTAKVPNEPLTFSAGALFDSPQVDVTTDRKPRRVMPSSNPGKARTKTSKPRSSSPSRTQPSGSRGSKTSGGAAESRETLQMEKSVRKESIETYSQPSVVEEVGADAYPERPEKELHDVEMQARDAARVGDNALAAQICLDAIKLFGEEPTLVSIFKEVCARLGVAPTMHSYPSGAYLLTAKHLYVGDELPISYDVRYRGRAPASDTTPRQELGFLALFYADDEMDGMFERLLRSTPTGVDQAFSAHSSMAALALPSEALTRVALTKSLDRIVSS